MGEAFGRQLWSWPPQSREDDALSLPNEVVDNASWVLIDFDSAMFVQPGTDNDCFLPGVVSLEDPPPPNNSETDLNDGFHFGCELAKTAIRLLYAFSNQVSETLDACLLQDRDREWYGHRWEDMSGQKQACRQRRYLPYLFEVADVLGSCVSRLWSPAAQPPDEAVLLLELLDDLAGRPPRNYRSIPPKAASLASVQDARNYTAGAACRTWAERASQLQT